LDAVNRHTEEKKVELNQLAGRLGEGLCAKATAAINMNGEHAGTHKVLTLVYIDKNEWRSANQEVMSLTPSQVKCFVT